MRDRWLPVAETVQCQGSVGRWRCSHVVHLTDEQRAAWERGDWIFCEAHVETHDERRAA